MITVLEEEVEAFVGAQRYARSPSRRDQRNGHYPRDLGTSVGVIEDLPVPRTRQGFRPRLFERYQRRQAELAPDWIGGIGRMFVQGVSTSRVGEVVETLTGSKPSASTASRVFDTLEGEFEAWKKRPLGSAYLYAFADGTYFTVIYDWEGCKTPILAVVGINRRANASCWASASGSARTSKPGKSC